MHIQCKNCNHCEKTDMAFFAKIIGGVTAGMGYWAWVAYFFAGTGFAMPICIAIMAGGGAMMAYSDKIIVWISKNYLCPSCKGNRWIAIDDDAANKLRLEQEKSRLAQQKIQQLNAEIPNTNRKLSSYPMSLTKEKMNYKNILKQPFKKIFLLIPKILMMMTMLKK